MHKAAKMLNSTVISRISSGESLFNCNPPLASSALLSGLVAALTGCAVVIFGDPLNGTAVGTVDPSKVLVICHAQDLICKGQWIVDSDHLDVSFSFSFFLYSAQDGGVQW